MGEQVRFNKGRRNKRKKNRVANFYMKRERFGNTS